MHAACSCVLFELFTDGECPFDLAAALRFRQRDRAGPDAVVQRSLIAHDVAPEVVETLMLMLDWMPANRLSASKVDINNF